MEPGTLCYIHNTYYQPEGPPLPDIISAPVYYYGIYHDNKTLLCVTTLAGKIEHERTLSEGQEAHLLKHMNELPADTVKKYIDHCRDEIDNYKSEDKKKIETLNKFKKKYTSAEEFSPTKVNLKF